MYVYEQVIYKKNGAFAVGDVCRIQGLVSALEFNGLEGPVVGRSSEFSRWILQVTDADGNLVRKNVKVGNLQLVERAPAASSSGPAVAASGGSAAAASGPAPSGGDGGSGGGGAGGNGGSAGTANTGGGGGGAGPASPKVSGAGGKGVVILRYKFQ